MEKRITKLQRLLHDKQFDAVVISSPANIVYLSSFSGFSSVERDGYLLITKNAGYILTNSLYREAVKEQVSHLELLEYSSTTPLGIHLAHLTKQHTLQRVGFEGSNLTVSEWNYFRKNLPKLSPLDLHTTRIYKSADEIHHITEAARIADKALQKIKKHIKPGITEKTLVFLLENEIRKAVSDVAFPTIVAYGKNAAIPHHKSDDTQLEKNNVILIDFGATSNEYRSDMTRTFFIGRPSQSQIKAYRAVLAAQQQSVSFISDRLKDKQQIVASEVDTVARSYLTSQGYPSIPHSLGHGIGLAVHEAPHLSPKSDETLSDGMVFSIEPGIYLPGKFGIRIEDLYTIQAGRLKQLTHFPSQLQEI